MTENEKKLMKSDIEKSLTNSMENKTNVLEKTRFRKARKRKKPLSEDENSLNSEEESEIDISLEKKLTECAKRNNLSSIEVKKLLRKIVGNDHVLALVKLQEEEELDIEKNFKITTAENSADLKKSLEIDNVDNTPKLTRAKAKELNKKPVSLPSLNEFEQEPEITALITEEIQTDDEDEDDEYEPKEEDYMYSEDDLNTTASDLDSQPRTPLTNIISSEVESPISSQKLSPQYSTDGVFKIPRERTASGLTKEDEIIAKRTRSKFCLETTSIEALESTFIPPDITTDMYELDQDIDQEWKEFLNEFTRPLNNITVAEEDDPEADPEYIAADKIPIDAEELKDVNISKKELNDLVAELFEGLIKEGVILENIPDLDTSKKLDKFNNQKSIARSPQKKKQKFCVESQPIFTSPTCERFSDNHFNIPLQIDNSINQTEIITVSNDLVCNTELNTSFNYNTMLNQNESVFVPNLMSTPVNNQNIRTSIFTTIPQVTLNSNTNYYNNCIHSTYVPTQASTEVVNIQTNVRVSPCESSEINSTNIVPNVNLQIQPLEPVVNENQQLTSQEKTVTLICYPIQGGPPTYKTVPLTSLTLVELNTSNNNSVPRPQLINTMQPNELIDLTNENVTVQQPQNTNNTAVANNLHLDNKGYRNKSGFVSHSDVFEMWRGDAHKSAEKYYKKLYEQKYMEMLHSPVPKTINNYERIGFTTYQKQIFEQQLRVHVQILTQNYLQTYSHPQFWQKAKSQKDFLLDLEEKSAGKMKSAFNACNLKDALILINEWENELAEENEENQKFMDFIYHQIERCELIKHPRGNRIIRFPTKTMKKILKSNVFIYPELLPRLPFRNSSHADYHDLVPIESHLLAFELEKYLPGVEKLIKYEKRKNNAVRLTCDKISFKVMTGKSGRRLYDFYKQELNSPNYNPIKYFNEKNCAPPFQNYLVPINTNSLLPPIKNKYHLPMLWKNFALELEASELKRDKATDKAILSETYWSKKYEAKQRRKERKEEKKERKREKSKEEKKKYKSQNVVINLNYVLENPNQCDYSGESIPKQIELQQNSNNETITKIERPSSTTDYSQIFTRIHEPLDIKFGDDASYLQYLNVQYPRSNLPGTDKNYEEGEYLYNQSTLITQYSNDDENTKKQMSGQKRLTDYFSSFQQNTVDNPVELLSSNEFTKILLPKPLPTTDICPKRRQKHRRFLNLVKQQSNSLKFSLRRSRYGFRSFKFLNRLKERKRLRNKLKNLLIQYWKYLHQLCNRYKSILLRKCFIHFKKIEIYTDFLEILKIFCHKSQNHSKSKLSDLVAKHHMENDITTSETTSTGEDNLMNFTIPKSCDIVVNTKNGINANNFFETVSETFSYSGKEIKFRKFLSILKYFNPEIHSTVWLYNKMEKLFFPNYPTLAEIFLYFLLPAEAYEAGTFFKNYMVSNKEFFIDNLVSYFEEYQNKIKQIYNCLDELENRNIEPTTEDIKNQLSKVLNENSVLNEWLQQIFIENIMRDNSKSDKTFDNTQGTSITFEAKDLIGDLSELQSSESKYINARLTSISKVFLPKKLASFANSLVNGELLAMETIEFSSQMQKDNDILHTNNENLCENEVSSEILKCSIEGDSDERTGISELVTNVNASINENNISNTDKIDNSQSSGNLSLKNIENYFEETQPLTNQNILDFSQKKIKKPCYNHSDNLDNNSISINRDHEDVCKTVDNNNKNRKIVKKLKINIKKSKIKKNENKNLKKHERLTTEKEISKELNQKLPDKEDKIEKLAWTRDEDKTILEEASLNSGTHDDLLHILSQKLISRNFTEINERFNFLMNLLSKLKAE